MKTPDFLKEEVKRLHKLHLKEQKAWKNAPFRMAVWNPEKGPHIVSMTPDGKFKEVPHRRKRSKVTKKRK